MLADAFAALPGEVELVEPAPVDSGRCRRARGRASRTAGICVLRVRPEAERRLLLTGHMDTVFPPIIRSRTLRWLDDETLNGPGVADMKGGIAVMLARAGGVRGDAAARRGSATT